MEHRLAPSFGAHSKSALPCSPNQPLSIWPAAYNQSSGRPLCCHPAQLCFSQPLPPAFHSSPPGAPPKFLPSRATLPTRTPPNSIQPQHTPPRYSPAHPSHPNPMRTPAPRSPAATMRCWRCAPPPASWGCPPTRCTTRGARRWDGDAGWRRVEVGGDGLDAGTAAVVHGSGVHAVPTSCCAVRRGGPHWAPRACTPCPRCAVEPRRTQKAQRVSGVAVQVALLSFRARAGTSVKSTALLLSLPTLLPTPPSHPR